MLTYQNTPIEPVSLGLGVDVRLLIKREDLNNRFVTGNKWWKLKYNLEEAQRLKQKKLLTFGGAYSNHIYATAAVAQEAGFSSIGVIRGERVMPLNATLRFAEDRGMELVFISREEYRRKKEERFVSELRNRWGDFYLIPEGGSNALALKGCTEWGYHIQQETDFDFLCLATGTGATLAGLAASLKPNQTAIGYAVLKGAEFLNEDVRHSAGGNFNGRIETAYHFGGYGKINSELKNFMSMIERETGIPLDPVYTAKALFGLMDQIKAGKFPAGSTVLFLHTGGLQGRSGFNL